jgi:hypothetical protein
MMNCAECQAPGRSVWRPIEGRPIFNKVEQRGWFGLSECHLCGVLWMSAPYEPYASFVHLVSWPHSKAQWSPIAQMEDGKVISSWCDSEIKLAFPNLDEADRAAIEDHRRRSYGRAPIDESGAARSLDLSRYLEEA